MDNSTVIRWGKIPVMCKSNNIKAHRHNIFLLICYFEIIILLKDHNSLITVHWKSSKFQLNIIVKIIICNCVCYEQIQPIALLLHNFKAQVYLVLTLTVSMNAI